MICALCFEQISEGTRRRQVNQMKTKVRPKMISFLLNQFCKNAHEPKMLIIAI